MDFVKKFAQEQLEKQMGGGEQKQHGEGNYNQNQNQNQNQDQIQNQGQGYGNQQYGNQQSGYGGGNNDSQGGLGGLLNSFTGGQQQGQQQQIHGGQQQQSFGGGQSGGFGVTGGAEYNAPHGSGGASSYGVPGGFGIPNINQNEAIQAANQHAGNGNENASLFSQAFSFIQGMNKDDKDVDEDDVQRKHEAAYGLGQSGNMSANAIGAAAAMQAIKQFTSGNSPAAGGSTQKGGNDMVSKIIGMAVSEAAKLFDKSGGAASGTKEDAVTSAGQTVMKLLIKNQVSGMMGGGQSGGLGSLMSMASKYM